AVRRVRARGGARRAVLRVLAQRGPHSELCVDGRGRVVRRARARRRLSGPGACRRRGPPALPGGAPRRVRASRIPRRRSRRALRSTARASSGAARACGHVRATVTRARGTRPAMFPETVRLYHQDPLALEFTARVVGHGSFGGAPTVVLDRTAFYPESGGQMADRGTLAGAEILDVQVDDEGTIHHRVGDRT